VIAYLVISITMLPIFFREYHVAERYGVFLFLLLAALLSSADADQTEEGIARRHHQPIFPPARPLVRGLTRPDTLAA
jgi:hypothetical protein